MVTLILKSAGYFVGMTCSDGVSVDGRMIDQGDCAGPRSAKNVLLNPLVNAAVFEAARGGILREGLGVDKCDVALVTNIGAADHLGKAYIDSPEDMFKVKRTPVDVVLPTGVAVLNATDSLVAEMAELSAGGVTFFSRDPDHPVIQRHRESGRRTVVVRNRKVMMCDGANEELLISLDELPSTHGGRVGFQVENVLAAAAAGWALGVELPKIAAGLQSFQGNLFDNPARFNVLESADKTLVVTDGRNSSALAALIEALDNFPHERRTVVYSAEEDRRDCDITSQGELLGQGFDRVILCEIEAGSERLTGDVTRLLRVGVERGDRAKHIDEIRDWTAAVDTAWSSLGRGEMLVIQTCSVPKTVRKLQSLLGLEPTDAVVPRLEEYQG
jgi:cyanophycin synthetase